MNAPASDKIEDGDEIVYLAHTPNTRGRVSNRKKRYHRDPHCYRMFTTQRVRERRLSMVLLVGIAACDECVNGSGKFARSVERERLAYYMGVVNIHRNMSYSMTEHISSSGRLTLQIRWRPNVKKAYRKGHHSLTFWTFPGSVFTTKDTMETKTKSHTKAVSHTKQEEASA